MNVKEKYLFLHIIAFHLMKNCNYEQTLKEAYETPSMRFIATNMEASFLQSNLEPIDGGDDPDIDW